MKNSEERILVVDDMEPNREVLERHLRRRGYSTRTAENGLRAMEILREEQFDLILLDIMMPEMNGFQVLEELHNDEELRHIPVIVISALDDQERAVKCIEMGAADYLTKPFEPTVLNARVSSSLEKKRWRNLEKEYLGQIEQEKKRADNLLRMILPDSIAEELMSTNRVEPRRHENVVILFADVVDFTSYCDRREPGEVLSHLQEMVQAFELLVQDYDLLKMKTIGDSFMATAGLLQTDEESVHKSVRCGLEMIAAARSLPAGWNLRVGIHIGPVIAGVVGQRQYTFDVWGDSVNTAARVEQCGAEGAVNLSREAWERVATDFAWSSSMTVSVKGKDNLDIYCVKPPAHASDASSEARNSAG